MSRIGSTLTRAERATIKATRNPPVHEGLSGQQIARFVLQSSRKQPTSARIEVLLRHAEQFKTELMDARTLSAYTNATVSTARNLYRKAIALIKGELETIPHTQTQALKLQLKKAQQGLSALELSSSQGMYQGLTTKRGKLNYHA
jgi:hypothetical protein